MFCVHHQGITILLNINSTITHNTTEVDYHPRSLDYDFHKSNKSHLKLTDKAHLHLLPCILQYPKSHFLVE